MGRTVISQLAKSCLVLIASISLVACAGINQMSGGTSSKPGDLRQINHIVWTLQEFRSFDNYFGKLNDYRQAHGLPADVDGLPANASNPSFDESTSIQAFHLNSVCVEDFSPAWNESRRDVNRNNPGSKTGLMDGFVYSAAHYAIDENAAGNGLYYDTAGLRTMGYYTEREIPYYYFMATQFATSDRFFGNILSRTPPNRIANIAASALGVVNVPPPGAAFRQKTIFHLLQEAGITWKVYMTQGTYLGYFQPFFGQHQDRVVSIDEYFTDLQNGTLPQVAYIEPDNATNEHPGTHVQMGAAHMAKVINALMQSSSWKDSVFFLTYDHGGMYDHVPPQTAVIPDDIPPQLEADSTLDDYSRTGFRTPLIVVSPFSQIGYVSHTVMGPSAILKFIETRFDLPSLTARDAAQPSMAEFFDFSKPPNAAPPAPPEQPTDAPCTFQTLP